MRCNYERLNYQKQEEIRDHAIDHLEYLKGCSSVHGADLHNEIYNTDYYIIGTYKAEQWLKEFTFEAIEIIREYEQDNFGQVSTDFSNAENVVNMYVYIVGEQVLAESKHLQECWDRILEDDDLETIKQELENV